MLYVCSHHHINNPMLFSTNSSDSGLGSVYLVSRTWFSCPFTLPHLLLLDQSHCYHPFIMTDDDCGWTVSLGLHYVNSRCVICCYLSACTSPLHDAYQSGAQNERNTDWT